MTTPRSSSPRPASPAAAALKARPILVTGATGLLGGWLVPALADRGWTVLPFGGPTRGDQGVDLGDEAAVDALLARTRPSVVIHGAALAAAADCVRDPARARRINVEATANLARALSAHGGRLVHVSTDLVFGGDEAPYAEDAPPAPTSVYGESKADAERAALSTPDAVVVRTSLLFGPTRTARRGFFDAQVEALRSGAPIALFDDEWRTPLALSAAAEGLAAIAEADVRGLVHLGGPERMSRWEMGSRLARVLGATTDAIKATQRASIAGGEPRPRDVSLDSSRFRAWFPSIATTSFEDACTAMMG